jgi:hypothetical protein
VPDVGRQPELGQPKKAVVVKDTNAAEHDVEAQMVKMKTKDPRNEAPHSKGQILEGALAPVVLGPVWQETRQQSLLWLPVVKGRDRNENTVLNPPLQNGLLMALRVP